MYRPKKMVRRSFCIGFVMGVSCIGLIQDYLGLEEYIVFCRKHWVDIHWFSWIVVLSVFSYLLVIQYSKAAITESVIKERVMKALLIVLMVLPATVSAHIGTHDHGLHHVIEHVTWFRYFCYWAPVAFACLLAWAGYKSPK